MISRMPAPSSSVAVATVETLRETCSEAADTTLACSEVPTALPCISVEIAVCSSAAPAND